ncbi:MAG: large-conductance mechanosensitive channel protein MscL [Eubacteriales bacterium]|nr:large-conductance mechanosensitive channel protein MscL [Eubacteriales bacterium]
MWKELKKFMLRGNVMDLAIGLIMGSAFGAIVNSLVNDIIMPIIGFITAGINFIDLKIVLAVAQIKDGAVAKPEVAISYGKLIQVTLQFFIIGFTIFLIVKGMNKLRDKFDLLKELEAETTKPADVQLLEEIRDLLKANSRDDISVP